MPTPKAKDNSGVLFDNIMEKRKLTRDSHLAVFLDTPRSIISEIRGGRRLVSSGLLVRICEKTGMSLKTAKEQIATPRVE